METTGSCFCGAIAYRAEIGVGRFAICHCRDCQIISGSAFRTSAVVPPASFAITRGEPRTFHKTADSGKVRRLLFCGNCGTHLCSMPTDPSEPGSFVSLRIATSEGFAKLTPAAEIWCASRAPWLPPLDGTKKFDGQP